jgi:toxin ParE1/3/4
MARIEKRAEANLDLYELWEYVALKSPASADKLIRRINEVFGILAENPEIGHRQDDLAPGLRSFPVNPYVIFYRPLAEREGVEIVRVLHARRDRGRAFGRE